MLIFNFPEMDSRNQVVLLHYRKVKTKKYQPLKMVKNIQTIQVFECSSCLNVFGPFVGLAFKWLIG